MYKYNGAINLLQNKYIKNERKEEIARGLIGETNEGRKEGIDTIDIYTTHHAPDHMIINIPSTKQCIS